MDRKIFFIMLFATVIFNVQAIAQDGAPGKRDPRASEKISAAHAAYITQRLELTTAEAETFWPVYREYTEKRRAINREWREHRRTETNEKALLEGDLKTKQLELDLEKAYSHKFQEIIPAEKLVKLRQAEMDFRKLILRQIQQRRRN